MSAPALGKLTAVGHDTDDDAMDRARESLVATLAWMTASAIRQTDPTLSLGQPRGAADSWRASAGAMTPTATAGSGEVGRADGPLVAELESEALGPIRLTVQRTKAGLSVVVGVREAWASCATEAQRAGLEQALVAAGLVVSSVTFVRITEDGTAFALHDQGSPEAATAEGTHIATGEGARARPNKRKINTLG